MTKNELLIEIVDLSKSIVIHHIADDKDDSLQYARNRCIKPTWEDVNELLKKIYNELEK